MKLTPDSTPPVTDDGRLPAPAWPGLKHPAHVWRRSPGVGTSLILAAACLAVPNESRAAIDFVFNFLDPAGVGFNASGQVGADRRTGLNIAADVVEALFVNYTATINIDVKGDETGTSTLASAGSNNNTGFNGNGFGSRGDVMVKILGGADPNPGAADGNVSWNFAGFQWEPLSDFQPGELDLQSTASHELLHAVGFLSSINQDGTGAFGAALGAPTAWEPFDQWVADSNGSIINAGTFSLDSTRWNAASVGGTGPVNGLLFNGPNAVAANGGAPVPLYSPTTWAGGSSGSHTDTDFFTGANALMMNHSATAPPGQQDIRALSPIEIAMLRDIGFTQIVPEPSAALLVLTGAALVGAVRRRRA